MESVICSVGKFFLTIKRITHKINKEYCSQQAKCFCVFQNVRNIIKKSNNYVWSYQFVCSIIFLKLLLLYSLLFLFCS